MSDEAIRSREQQRGGRMGAVADDEVIRQGVRRALEAMDWLGEQAGGRLETRVSSFVDVIDGEPVLAVAGQWWPNSDDATGRKLEERVFNASTSKARMMWIARDMLDDYRRMTGTTQPAEEPPR